MQNLKRFLIITLAAAFCILLVAAMIMLFSVKKVSADFSVYGDSQAEEIQKELDSFQGKSLVFLKTADVYAVCEKYPYYEIVSVKKEYPNVLKVGVVKRTEVFRIETADKTYVLDKNGIVLNDTGDAEFPRNVLSVDLGSLTLANATVGNRIETSDDSLFYSVLKTAGSLELNDIVKSVEIADNGYGFRDAIFKTYTGVKVNVWNVDDEGEEKIQTAFSYYETLADHKKISCEINVYRVENPASSDNGRILAEWTSGN